MLPMHCYGSCTAIYNSMFVIILLHPQRSPLIFFIFVLCLNALIYMSTFSIEFSSSLSCV
jgi:hypothetical protein